MSAPENQMGHSSKKSAKLKIRTDEQFLKFFVKSGVTIFQSLQQESTFGNITLK